MLRVRAEADDASRSSRVSAPGSVEGLTADPTAASVLPPGLTGPPGSTGPLGVPDRVLTAYHSAEVLLARTRPGCAMPWWLLAGIGKVESGHASGGRVDRDGRTRGEVLGPLLDGSLAGTMVVEDTDRGVMDGDTAFDRAVGPDAVPAGHLARPWAPTPTATARPTRTTSTTRPRPPGVYLCRGGGSMTDPDQMRAAVLRYNGSDEYADAVITWGTSYRDRAVAVPGQDGTIGPAARGARRCPHRPWDPRRAGRPDVAADHAPDGAADHRPAHAPHDAADHRAAGRPGAHRAAARPAPEPPEPTP